MTVISRSNSERVVIYEVSLVSWCRRIWPR